MSRQRAELPQTSFLDASGSAGACSAASKAPRPVLEPAPACLEAGESCSTADEFAQLRRYAKAVDQSLHEQVQRVQQARQTYLRRVNNYKYAELTGKPQDVIDTLGPDGPRRPGGSYLYEMRRWRDAMVALHRECEKSADPSCRGLLQHMRDHPEDDTTEMKPHGGSGSQVYDELRRACVLGKSRAPIPNDEPVWCDRVSGRCEKPSGRGWWREAHPGIANPAPWVDKREDYGDLKEVCGWIQESKPTDQELNDLQRELSHQAGGIRQEFCGPKWVDGLCDPPPPSRLPGSEMNYTSEWKEAFPERPVNFDAIPEDFLIFCPTPLEPRRLEPAGPDGQVPRKADIEPRRGRRVIEAERRSRSTFL